MTPFQFKRDHYVRISTLLFTLALSVASCISNDYQNFSATNNTDLEFPQTPSSTNAIGIKDDEQANVKTSEPVQDSFSHLEIRLTYVTIETDDNNEISKTKLWILDPQYRDPELLLALEKLERLSGFINPQWATDKIMIAYTRLSKDGNSVVSILDTNKNEAKDLNFSTESLDELILLFEHSWSPNNEWFYALAYNNLGGTTRGVLVNVDNGQANTLNYEMQEEVLGWSPTNVDRYLSVLHPNFLDLGEEILQVKQIDTTKPLLTFPTIGEYSIPFGAKLLWAPNGQKGIIEAIDKSDQTTNLWIDLENLTWRNIPEAQNLRPSSWSPSGTMVAFESTGENLYILQIDDEAFSFLELPATKGANVIGWFTDGHVLVYEQNLMVYAVDVRTPETTTMLHDFRPTLEGILHYQFQILDQ